MSKYYPKGYRKRRKQERTQRIVGYVVIAVLVAGMAIGAAWGMVKLFTPGTPDRGTENLAARGDKLKEAKVEQEASKNPPPIVPPVKVNAGVPAVQSPVAAAPATAITLADIKEFQQSFPEIGILLKKGGESATDGAPPTDAQPTPAGPRPGEAPVPGETAHEPDHPTPPGGAESVRPGPPVSREPAKPDSPPASGGSSGSTSKPPVKPSGGASGDAGAKPSGGSGGAKGDYVYAVYAGLWDDKDVASKKIDELKGVGYAAQIIEINDAGKGKYFVLVEDKLDSYDKAKEIQGDLKAKGFGDSFIRKKNS